MTLLVNILLGVISAIIATIVWVAAIRLIRPHFKISSKIALMPEDEQHGHIKIINYARRAAVELKFELSLMSPTEIEGVWKRTEIKYELTEPLIIPGRDRSDVTHSNCYRIRYAHNLKKSLEPDGNFLRLRVYARDEVSGIGRVITQTYDSPESIVIGRFRSGDSFEINPAHPSSRHEVVANPASSD